METPEKSYKKMAGTSAVFIASDYSGATPVERDGMQWTANELHMDDLPAPQVQKPAMANALALEGLEEYDSPSNGDKRHVESIGEDFVYVEKIRGWVQIS